MRDRRCRSVLRVSAAATFALVASIGVATPAWAGLDGCSGTATSKDGSGNVIDQATVQPDGTVVDENGDEVFTQDNPFKVDNEGTVDYDGQSASVITDHGWRVKVMGIEVVSGGSANSQGDQGAKGTLDLGEELPVKITGLVKADGDLTGKGGSCTGDGYVEVQGNALASPVTWAGIVFAGLGLLGMALALPKVRRPPRGVV